MLKNLNKEIIIKKTLKQKLIETLISSFFWAIILYFCLTVFNDTIIYIFNSVAEGNSEVEFVLLVLPIMIIVGMMITLGNFVISEGKNK